MLGRRIGTYEVISKLGEGGMGVVYLARHATLGRLAAVKVLLPEFSNNRDIVARFFNEARAATAIRNPGIVEVYDFGFLEDQHAYIIMEYLEGESLGTRLRRGPVSLASVLSTTRGIARALHAAHDKGIVHRDLKPDNIFLVPDEDLRGGERVKLLDFGIAKLTATAAEPSQTRTGMVIGTPTYMAPEQCRASSSIDLRADLYALGCVVYEMLCGQPPFVANTAADILAHHLYFEPQRASVLRPDVPPAVDQLVSALLAKDPANRPASAAAVVTIIDSLAGEPSAADSIPIRPMAPISAAYLPAAGGQGVSTTLSSAAGATEGQPRRSRRALAIGIAVAVAGVATVAILALRSTSSKTGGAPPADAMRVAIAPDAPVDAAPPAPEPLPDAVRATEPPPDPVPPPKSGSGKPPPVKKKPPVIPPPPPPPPPGTGSQAEIAARLNDEGKNLMYSGQYEAASRKFRDAVARAPEAKYFFNLCTALFQEGKFGEAMSACNAVARNQPTADQQRKTDKLLEKIKEFAKEQGIDLGGR